MIRSQGQFQGHHYEDKKKNLPKIKFLSSCLIYGRIKLRNQGQRSKVKVTLMPLPMTSLYISRSGNGTWYGDSYAMVNNKFCVCIHCRDVEPRVPTLHYFDPHPIHPIRFKWPYIMKLIYFGWKKIIVLVLMMVLALSWKWCINDLDLWPNLIL